MTFLRDLLSKGFPPKTGVQGLSGTFNPVQGTQAGQGVQGITGYQSGTLLVNSQSGQYNLQASDVGKVVTGVTTVGISSNVFNPGDIITILNNSNTDTLKVALNSPAVKLSIDGDGVVSNTQSLTVKSFASLICTKLNQFVLSHTPFIGITATGGNAILTNTNYSVHVFTGSGTFSITSIPSDSPGTIEYLVVAGGGTATGYGGGGAGGYRTGTLPISIGSYPVLVGGSASPTTFSTITSSAGGSPVSTGGVAGGSGGGGGVPNGIGGAGNTPPVSPPQGNPGGNGNGPTSSGEGGGGGGAGLSGSNSTPIAGGPGGGGSGIDWGLPPAYGTPGPSPSLRYFAGGGGGAATPSGGPSGGSGGYGGGGNGRPNNSPTSATAGTVNTGGGSGAGGPGGGSGIVLIRYKRI